MRKLLIVSVVGVVVVAGMALFAAKILSDFAQKDEALRKVLDQRAAALRETNRRFPYQPRPTLDPARFPVYLEVRQAIAREFESRIQEHSRNKFHARRTHNELLKVLRLRLSEQKMSLLEYRTTAARWRALARPVPYRASAPAWSQPRRWARVALARVSSVSEVAAAKRSDSSARLASSRWQFTR